jgi:hypothetical protein
MSVEAQCPCKVWNAKCYNRPRVTCAHAPRQVLREKRDKAMAIKQAKRENEWLVAKFKEEEVHRNRVSR